MEWYRFDPETGEYLHPVRCQPHPKHKGKHLEPYGATPICPPKTSKAQVAVFNENQWRVVDDYRSKTVYHKHDKSELEIKKLGPIPATHTLDKPGAYDGWDEAAQRWIHDSEEEHTAKTTSERDWAMNELALTDRCLTPDFPITEAGRDLITQYRQLLRNPQRANHPEFPNKEWRPTWPKEVKRPAS